MPPAGVQGAEPPVGVSGAKPPEADGKRALHKSIFAGFLILSLLLFNTIIVTSTIFRKTDQLLELFYCISYSSANNFTYL